MPGLSLVVAGVKIRLSSRREALAAGEVSDFIGGFPGRPDIQGEVRVERALPRPRGRILFETIHPLSGEANWAMRQDGRGFAYVSRLEGKEVAARIRGDLSRFTAWLKPRPAAGLAWDPSDLVFDFLQVLLIAWLARRGRGLVLHAAGVGDRGRGLVFAGKSGAGKSTTARFWDAAPGARVFNDDRVCVTFDGGPRMHALPWRGEFGGRSRGLPPCPVDRVFLLGRGRAHSARRLSPSEAFAGLYPATFPAFWDRESLLGQAGLVERLASRSPCFRLDFAKSPSVVDFVRGLDGKR